jgi:acyl-[acyl carrier protein]--UDP-N-acetylglucosamine O-acyltransferase
LTIHPTALVSAKARIAESVEIGAFTIVHDNVVIGAGTKIDSHCVLGIPTSLGDGSPLTIGAYSFVRSHSVFYESALLGAGLVTGHYVTIRELTRAGEGVQIGSQSDVQGHCTFGDHVKLQTNVFIGKHSVIEDFAWLFPHVVLTNDPHPPSLIMRGPTVRTFAAIGAGSTILPGIVVGEGALVGACSAVTRDVGDHRIVAGNPAKDRGPTSRIKLSDGSGRPAYPWNRHFHRGYPEAVVAGWLASIGE